MASMKAFNSVIQSFLTELTELYGKGQPTIGLYSQRFALISEASPSLPLDMFMKSYGAYSNQISNKDESLFNAVPLLFNEIDVSILWKETTEDNKEAIWKYLQTLMLLGTTIRMIPSDMLASIENIASDCASKVESGQMNPASLLSAIPSLLSSFNFNM
jgi:hypothetical protein